MTGDADLFLERNVPEALRKIRERTPARIFMGRCGAAYRTEAQLELRQAHAAARDAVRTEFGLETSLDADFVNRWNLFEVSTEARSKEEFLARPDLGRRFSEDTKRDIAKRCLRGGQLQIVIGDGLSVTAVSAQVPSLLPLLFDGGVARRWVVGQPFAIRYCRVGILNQIGELLAPEVAVLLVGERPGLATSESLSAYMAYRPVAGHTDANRNLISNIHSRGVSPQSAADRILNLAALLMAAGMSGVAVKEELLAAGRIQAPPE